MNGKLMLFLLTGKRCFAGPRVEALIRSLERQKRLLDNWNSSVCENNSSTFSQHEADVQSIKEANALILDILSDRFYCCCCVYYVSHRFLSVLFRRFAVLVVGVGGGFLLLMVVFVYLYVLVVFYFR